jgi:hypothetical protein
MPFTTESMIAEIQATTANLTLEEKKALLVSLERDIEAAAEKQDGPKKRLASVKAAAVSKDPRTKEAFNNAVRGLQGLGYDLEAIAASGSIAGLDETMRQYKWDRRENWL